MSYTSIGSFSSPTELMAGRLSSDGKQLSTTALQNLNSSLSPLENALYFGSAAQDCFAAVQSIFSSVDAKFEALEATAPGSGDLAGINSDIDSLQAAVGYESGVYPSAVSISARLAAAEAVNADSRLTALESVDTTTSADVADLQVFSGLYTIPAPGAAPVKTATKTLIDVLTSSSLAGQAFSGTSITASANAASDGAVVIADGVATFTNPLTSSYARFDYVVENSFVNARIQLPTSVAPLSWLITLASGGNTVSQCVASGPYGYMPQAYIGADGGASLYISLIDGATVDEPYGVSQPSLTQQYSLAPVNFE